MGKPATAKVIKVHSADPRALEHLEAFYQSLRRKIMDHPGQWSVTSTVYDGGRLLIVEEYPEEVSKTQE